MSSTDKFYCTCVRSQMVYYLSMYRGRIMALRIVGSHCVSVRYIHI